MDWLVAIRIAERRLEINAPGAKTLWVVSGAQALLMLMRVERDPRWR